MKKEIRTEIAINSSPESVWRVLTDFDRYSEWNPFIIKLSGIVAIDNKIKVTLNPPNGKTSKFKPKVLTFDENKRFSWMGRLIIPGIFDGEHIFELIDNNDGTTTFVHREQFRGILVKPFSKKLDTDIKAGFEQMNAALKERVEGQ